MEGETLHLHVPDDSKVFIHVNGAKINPKEGVKVRHSRNVNNYNNFLKILKKKQAKRFSCPVHLHPRPWVPPPCRTSRPFEVEKIESCSRSHSNPEFFRKLTQIMESNEDAHTDLGLAGYNSEGGYNPNHHHLQTLYKEARVLKEALENLQSGKQLPKETHKIVHKWNKVTGETEDGDVAKSIRRDDTGDRLSALEASYREAQKEEEALRQELKSLRESANSREELYKENKKLRHKVRRLQNRLKRQEEKNVASVSSGHSNNLDACDNSFPGPGGVGETYAIMALKRKYKDLLRHVLKIESENKKLKNEVIGSRSDSGQEDDGDVSTDKVVTRLKTQMKLLQQDSLQKENYIKECREQLKEMDAMQEENFVLQRTLQEAVHKNTDHEDDQVVRAAALEEEWLGRLAETRQMYERAIQGYRNQLVELQQKKNEKEQSLSNEIQDLQNKIVNRESGVVLNKESSDQHTLDQQSISELKNQISKLKKKLKESDLSHERERTIIDNRLLVERGTEGLESNKDVYNYQMTIDNYKKQILQMNELIKSYDDEIKQLHLKLKETNEQSQLNNEKLQDSRSNLVELQNREHDKEGPNLSEQLHRHQQLKLPQDLDVNPLYMNLEHLIKRLEDIKYSGEWTSSTLAAIRETINASLNDWREKFQIQAQPRLPEAAVIESMLRSENEELLKKLQSYQKKLDYLKEKCKTLTSENKLLDEKYSQTKKTDSSQLGSHLDVLQNLPEILQDTERRLTEALRTVQQAQGEKIQLQDQIQQLQDKLAKKDFKLKAERDTKLSLEKEASTLRETLASLQRQVDEMHQELNHLNGQMTTKDSLLDRTSAQLDERIRECVSLSSQVERAKLDRDSEIAKLRSQVTSNDTSSQQHLIDTQAARYQAQLSVLRIEKEHMERNLQQQVRRLEDQLDQLQLRNSTLQRQLGVITSTYHTVFSSQEYSPPP